LRVPIDSGELVRRPRTEAGRDVLLAFGQHVDAELAAGLDGLPRPRHLGRAEQHEWWFQRQSREGLAREADRDVVVNGGDDRDAGAELTQHATKRAGVD